MDKNFNFGRFHRCFSLFMSDYMKPVFRFAMWLIIIRVGFWAVNFSGDFNPEQSFGDASRFADVIGFAVLISLVVTVSGYYWNREESIRFLLLPASNLEKYLAWALSLVLGTALFWFGSTLVSYILWRILVVAFMPQAWDNFAKTLAGTDPLALKYLEQYALLLCCAAILMVTLMVGKRKRWLKFSARTLAFVVLNCLIICLVVGVSKSNLGIEWTIVGHLACAIACFFIGYQPFRNLEICLEKGK